MKPLMKKLSAGILMAALFFSACKKQDTPGSNEAPQQEDGQLKAAAQNYINEQRKRTEDAAAELQPWLNSQTNRGHHRPTLAGIATSVPFFKSLVAAAVKTGLVATLASPEINATLFAPTDRAFAKLPAPFNNETNISAITDSAQINALKNILLYHVLGTEVKRAQIPRNRSTAETLKAQVLNDDNNIYLSNSLGLLLVNGNSLVLFADLDASNGVVHVIDDVLLPPAQNIAQIAIGNPAFSTLVAALIKTNLAGVVANPGNFTVFAPTNDAFAKLPAPFNNAQNITAITDNEQIAALANIIKYHVTGSRYFGWDLGIFQPITTLANAPNNRITGILGLNGGFAKGNQNNRFSRINPGNILATNGVIQVIDQVLLP
jgi:uncharacterized surface protein with fasciclin (FAS1) repeats